MNKTLKDWIARVPKAELHLHLDGSLQAERMLSLGKKNGIELPYKSVAEVHNAYNFSDLQSFLDLYYLGASVLREEDDFYHLMFDYLSVCREQNIVHTEIMIEPQTYLPYGVEINAMMVGFKRAMTQAENEWGQSVYLILSFLRHLPEEEALDLYDKMASHLGDFVAIGLASAEVGNPPEKFTQLYARAKADGLRSVVHAGEEGPPEYIWSSLKTLSADRIDHGVRCAEDPVLVAELKAGEIPLTVCPLSNVKLCVVDNLSEHNVLDLLELGLRVTINSDDPAYFGGYLNENYNSMAEQLSMNEDQARQLIENSFKASFLPQTEKDKFLSLVGG